MKKNSLILFVFLSVLFTTGLYFDKQSRVNKYLSEHTKNNLSMYEFAYNEYKTFSNYIYNSSLNKKEIIEIMDNMDEGNKDKKRKQLYEKLLPTYKYLQEQNIRQLHFHLPTNDSFLRFHRPNKYGDNLTDIRKTVEYVNSYHEPIDTFEEGRIFNGFRFVYPLKNSKNSHLGSVECSISALAFKKTIENSFDIKVNFIIDKDVVENKVFDSEKKLNYTQCAFSSNYLCDNAIENTKSHNDYSKMISSNLDEEDKRELDKKLKENSLFTYILRDDKSEYTILTFMPIINKLSNKKPAYIVFSYSSDYLQFGLITYIFANIFAFILAAFLTYIYYLNRFKQKKIEESLSLQSKSLKDLEALNTLHNKAQHITKMGHWRYVHKEDNLYWSNEIYHIFNRKKRSMGSCLKYNEFRSFIYEDDLIEYENILLLSIENETSYDFIYRIIDPLSKKIKYIKEIGHHEYNKEGEIETTIGTLQDITVIIESETERSKLNKIIEQLPLSIVITDINGNIEYANQAFSKITGYSFEEVLDKNPRIFKSGFTSEEEYKQMWEKIKEKHIYECEFNNIKKDKSAYRERAVIFPLLDKKNNIINYVGIKQDITKYKELSAKVEEQNRMLLINTQQSAMNSILQNIAHHWRQPLSIASTGLNNIKFMYELEESFDENKIEIMENIDAGLEQIEFLTGVINNFTKHFENNDTLESANINDIIESSLSLYNTQLEEIKVEKDFEPLSPVITNQNELLKVVCAIIDNSYYFLNINNKQKEKKIKIKTYEEDEKIFIEIIDNAGGVNKKYIDKIYEPYFSTKVEQNNVGLGLYMCKMLLSKLHGDIKSENFENGLKVTVSLNK